MQTWIAQHPPLFFCFILAGVMAFRWLLLNLIAIASGWRILGRRFPAQQPFSAPVWKWQSARMRYLVGYNNCLKVGADQMGLFIRTMWGARTAHPPLYVPWNEISVTPEPGGVMGPFVRFSLGRSEQIPFTVRKTLADKLHAAAGQGWPASPAPVK
jgi:hypothetical protein